MVDLLPQTHDKETIPTNFSIKTRHTHKPIEISFLRPPASLLLPPKCKPPITVEISFLRPMTKHPKNQNLPYPPFPQTNIYHLPQTHDKDHYRKPQTSHIQTPSHLPSRRCTITPTPTQLVMQFIGFILNFCSSIHFCLDLIFLIKYGIRLPLY